MFTRLLLLFVCIPLLEIYTLFQVGHLIGLLPTLAIILLTGISGAYLAQAQGLELLRNMDRELKAGRMPTETMLEGLLVLVGGVLLLTPGFWTDFLGFLFLLPQTRMFAKRWLRGWVRQRLERGDIRFYQL